MGFTEYYAPTHVYFGSGTEEMVGEILKKEGAKKVLIHFGLGSVEKSGLLDKVRKSLKENNLLFVELGGVQPNPRLSLARKGIELCRKENVDFILAVGGGSVLDSAKCISYGVPYDGDVWDFYTGKQPSSRLPFGDILTLSATGSEMSNSSVITNDEKTPNDKFGSNTNLGRPVFSILDPTLTYTVSKYQTGSGSTDIIMHTLERFFHKGPVLDITDRIAASVIRSVIDNTKIALENPTCYDARASLMWSASISHNDLTHMGYETRGDWCCHKMEHELSALYDVAHGAGLAAIWASWARYVKNENPARFARLGQLVFGFKTSDTTIAANSTIDMMEEVFKSFGMPTSLSELGIPATEETCRILAQRATANNTKTLGNFKSITQADSFAIYMAAR